MRVNGVGLVALIVAIGAASGGNVGAAVARPAEGAASTVARNCSADYGGKPETCVRVACSAKYQAFIGTWRGRFHAYVRKQSTPGHAVFRPYAESVAYSVGDCLHNRANGDVSIVGHETNHYPKFGKLPAKVERDLLITGRRADGAPFLRTVRSDGAYDYTLVFQDEAASLSIWRLQLPAAKEQLPMAFTTIDGRDFSTPSKDRRNVTITMQVGPDKTPYWQGVIAYGSHARQG
ncbi:MAG: hypothetical protein ACREPH_04540 [Rhodanobacteraceae bacterium]